MQGVNKAIIIGHLGRDPELRYTPSGQAVANFSVATTESWTNKQTNNKDSRTEWHRIVVWGRRAEICKEYLKKGRAVFIEGRLQTRNWEDREGHKRYTTEIVANNVQFLGSRGEAVQEPSSSDSSDESLPQIPEPPKEEVPFSNEDDIPF